MTTSDGVRNRLRKELAGYLARPHRTKKHQKKAFSTVAELFLKSRRTKIDGWKLIESLSGANGNKVTAPELKAALRDLLVKLQLNRCCYCRRWLVNNAYARPIEHVLPRSGFPQFSLHFWNLAVSCTDCNALKTNDIWSISHENFRTYPVPESVLDWFHPRFHEYDQHVRYLRLDSNGVAVIVFIGLTTQGRALCKSLLSRIAAMEMAITNNPILSTCMASLNEAGDRLDSKKADKLRAFQEELSISIARMGKS